MIVVRGVRSSYETLPTKSRFSRSASSRAAERSIRAPSSSRVSVMSEKAIRVAPSGSGRDW